MLTRIAQKNMPPEAWNREIFQWQQRLHLHTYTDRQKKTSKSVSSVVVRDEGIKKKKWVGLTMGVHGSINSKRYTMSFAFIKSSDKPTSDWTGDDDASRHRQS